MYYGFMSLCIINVFFVVDILCFNKFEFFPDFLPPKSGLGLIWEYLCNTVIAKMTEFSTQNGIKFLKLINN